MSRLIKTIDLPPVDLLVIAKKVSLYLTGEGFRPVQYKKEGQYYKKYGGWFEPHQYIKFGFKSWEMTVAAFVKFPLFPGIGVGEMGITGEFCPQMRTALTRSVNDLQSYTRKVVNEYLQAHPGRKNYPEVTQTVG